MDKNISFDMIEKRPPPIKGKALTESILHCTQRLVGKKSITKYKVVDEKHSDHYDVDGLEESIVFVSS